MKYCMIIPDGAADRPLESLGGRTPLAAANVPNMDYIAQNGLTGTVRTVPPGMPPGSDCAVMSLLGYDPRKYYTGRAPLEAASLGIDLAENQVAFRTNLVTVADERMADYSAGHITSKEAAILIDLVNEELGSDSVSFYPGVSYRHIMVNDDATSALAVCTPPHDISGHPIREHLPTGPSSDLLRDLMSSSRKLLARHDINTVRLDMNQNPANMIWFWGNGTAPQFPTFQQQYGLSAAVISAVDLIKGTARYLEMEQINVPGATGYLDTDYAAKGTYAIQGLENHDLVIIHIEAPDEAAHEGNEREKIRALEAVDSAIVGPILQAIHRFGDYRILISPDHVTPCELMTHTAQPVPFAICGTGVQHVRDLSFSEASAAQGSVHIEHGHELMQFFLG